MGISLGSFTQASPCFVTRKAARRRFYFEVAPYRFPPNFLWAMSGALNLLGHAKELGTSGHVEQNGLDGSMRYILPMRVRDTGGGLESIAQELP